MKNIYETKVTGEKLELKATETTKFIETVITSKKGFFRH